jgi:hypothetical protein
MSNWNRQRIAFLSVVVIILSGCQPNWPVIHASSRPITILFDGFVYIGDKQGNLRGETLPDRFQSDHEYLFRHPLPLPVEPAEMGVDVLPQRLRQLGFAIVTAPTADGRNMLVFDSDGSGPGYSIVAEKEACRLTLTHVANPSLRSRWYRGGPDWELADYVLTVSGSCATL